MKRFVLLIFILSIVFQAFSQKGKHGNFTVTVADLVVNEYTRLTSDAGTGATTLIVQSNNLNANGRFSGPLEAGDLLMIIQMQGVTLNSFPSSSNPHNGKPYDDSWGTIMNYNNCGNYEFVEVAGVAGGNIIDLTCGLRLNYTASWKVQVIRVPRYNSLTINAPASITCDAWNGTSGGIVVCEVDQNISIAAGARIHADHRGFRGGIAQTNSGGYGGGQWSHFSFEEGAEKGESISGYQSEYEALGGGMYCKGAPANGGGGGNMHNAGGGGGGNGGDTASWSGYGNPDISNPNWITAWNLESAGFATHTSTGGGKGGYTFSINNRDALTTAPGNTLWGMDNRRVEGGLGGRPLEYSTGKIFLGGGGGAGHQNNDDGGSGGNGGGLVYILGYGDISGSGTINSNGQDGYPALGAAPGFNEITGTDGSGGAGAGGTIIVNIHGTVSGVSITANGGNGGNQIIQEGIMTGNHEAEGPGGGGGGGYIAISAGTPTRQANGGANGTTNSSGLTEFPPNGATAGGNGEHDATITPTVLTVPSPINACLGDDIDITALLSGFVPGGTQIIWWDQAAAGSVIHTGVTYSITNASNSDTVWVGFCPGWYRVPVIINISGPICVASPDTTICAGSSVQLGASGGVSYTWSPSGTLNNANIPNPVASPLTTTTYYVTATEGACESIDSVTVVVSEIIAGISADTSICAGESVQLIASGGGTYSWSNGGSLSNPAISNPVASPSASTTYTVTITNAFNCTATQSVTVTVHALPDPYLGPDTTICLGTVLTLDPGAGYTTYQWSPAGSNPTLDVSTSGTYGVTVTDANSCEGTDEIIVTVVNQMDATITSGIEYCSNSSPVNFTSTDAGGTWSGNGITNPATGAFDPSVAGAGSHQIIYEITGLCGDADTVNVTVHQAPVFNLGPDTTICLGTVLTLDPGAGYTTYQWSPAGSNPTLDVSTSGTYGVTVTDANSCEGTDEIIVTVVNQMDATITSGIEYCSNSSPVNFTSTDAGGTWSGNGITNPATGAFDPSVAGAGSHQIIYTILGACGDADTVTVIVHPAPVVDLGSTTIFCEGTNHILDAGAGYAIYDWNPSGSGQTYTVTTAGTYSVTVTDNEGCSGSATITMTEEPWADATIVSAGPFCSNDNSITMTASESGGTWSGTGISNAVSGTFDPSVAGAGTHEVAYTISGLCGDSDTTYITVYEAPVLNFTVTPESCAGAHDASVSIAISGGSSPYSVSWNHGAIDETLTDLAPGTYVVQVSDANSCSESGDIEIEAALNDCYSAHIYIPNVFSPNGDGDNDVLYVRGNGLEYIEFKVYNRWGEIVFQTETLSTGWDGTYKGQTVEPGVYSYMLRYTFAGESRQTMSGTITVVH